MSCASALKLKYGSSNSPSKPSNFIPLPQKAGRDRCIEMVGMEKIMNKQSNFSRLTEVVLSSMLINDAGERDELKELIPNVTNLDLSQNLLASWIDVSAVVSQLPQLSTLILSKNRLEIPVDVESYKECYTSLKMLVLNDMAYCWKEILSCAVMWPYIEELCVLDNRISILEVPQHPIFSKLKFLSLDNNPIINWTEICKLGLLTNLEELHIDNISLESILFPEVSPLEKTNLFPGLCTLFARNNKLKEWQDISELNKLINLKTLMINNNPVMLSVNPETARQLIIAKILGLETLNRTKVERSERRGAELDYLKKYHNSWLTSGGCLDLTKSKPSNAFLTEHPTYPALLQKHGAADENETKTESSRLKDNLVCVNIFSPLLPDKQPVTKKLPVEMTVGKLKALVQRIFKVGAQNVTLTRLFKEDESQKTEMDNNLRQLSYYSLSDQDKIA
ncbi:Tubulin-specific chaperone E, partial [Stegodyphus mimosarum]